MVASKLRKYLVEADKNGVTVASWAEATALPGVAKCKHCGCTVSFSRGKAMLLQHSESKKHIGNMPKSEIVLQMTIDECLKSTTEAGQAEKVLKSQIEEFEISLARSLSNHKISMQFIECLQAHLKKLCGDSKVVEQMSIGRRKAETIVRFGIGPGCQQETIKMVKEADGFSISFDESEVDIRTGGSCQYLTS